MNAPRGPVSRPAPGVTFRREHVMQQLHRIRTAKLQESLGVPEGKARNIADRWARFDSDSMDRRQEMKQLREQVNGTLMGPGSEEEKNAKLRPMLQRLAVLRQEHQAARRTFEEDIRSTLTPAQQGRFIMLTDEFDRSLREALQAGKEN